MTTHSLTINYGTPEHSIDAAALANSLLQMSALLHAINDETQKEGGKKINVRVDAVRPGSFEIDIQVLESFISSVFTNEGLAIGASLVSIFFDFLQIKLFLRDEKPTKVEEKGDVSIINHGNDNHFTINKNTFNLYVGSATFDQNCSNIFGALKDADINGLTVSTENEKLVIPKEAFTSMSEPSPMHKEEAPKQVQTKEATLYIARLSFESGLKSDFYYDNNRISCQMKDEVFFGGELTTGSFSKGDMLKVELEITQEKEKGISTWINKSYAVKKVFEHITAPQQEQMDFD